MHYDIGLYYAIIHNATPCVPCSYVDDEGKIVFDGVSTYFSREYIKLVSRKPIASITEGDYITVKSFSL